MTQISFDPILENYRQEAGAYDEMWLGPDRVQNHWAPFIQAISAQGLVEVGRLQHEAARQLHDNGVTYNVHGDPANLHRPWELDVIPLIIEEADWHSIEAGLEQRAELLNLILADIYGPRHIIKRGLIPPELIYSHAGFLRQCDRVRLMGKRQLVIYAADLARGPDGRMWVLADRTQAPSGAGYALENRTVLARLWGGMMRDNKVLRLSNFFRDFQSALSDLTIHRADGERVVILSPGPLNETYFEHAYLAAYLGYTLVQGDDLTVHGGRVSLKSLAGLQPVDVILRRVDDLYCDPLELREDSRLGVAGLLEASRRQNVAIANPLGSGVLENAGLMPFMAGLAKHLLGEDLLLPSAATWWCGQPSELGYVLEKLPSLVIKTLHRQVQRRTIYGFELDSAQLETLRQQILAQPRLYVGQELVSFPTTPSFINGKLAPRRAVLRCFSVGGKDGYTVMPGGLTRCAPESGGYIVSNQAGGVSKDTWVLTSKPQRHVSLWLEADRIERSATSSYYLPSRAAENLFWVGRYAERAEGAARLLRVILNLANDGSPLEPDDDASRETMPVLLQALTHMTMTYPGFVGEAGDEAPREARDELLSVALDESRAGSIRHDLRSLIQSAYAVRDLWSSDTWRAIERLDEHLPTAVGHEALDRTEANGAQVENAKGFLPGFNGDNLARPIGLPELQSRLNQLIANLMAFAGLNTESMSHEAGWLMLDTGRRLERALLTMSLIRAVFGVRHSASAEYLLLDATLRATENVITYRRRYRSHLQLQTVLDLLLLDATNPRSMTYQLDRLQAHIDQLPRKMAAYRMSEEERLVLDASTRLRLVDTAALSGRGSADFTREALDDFMADLSDLLSQLTPVLTQHFFTHVRAPFQQLGATNLAESAVDDHTP